MTSPRAPLSPSPAPMSPAPALGGGAGGSDRFPLVADGVRILDPGVGPDTMAVVGAMMSRAPDLGVRFDKLDATSAPDLDAIVARVLDEFSVGGASTEESRALLGEHRAVVTDVLRRFLDVQEEAAWNFRNPPAKVRAFLEENVSGYNHASIASMAKSCFVYAFGFGWPAAWLYLDAELFDGQEVSTRAVDATKIPGVNGPGTVCRYAPEGFQGIHDRWLAAYANKAAQAMGGGWKYDDARVYLPGTTPTGVVLTNDVRSIARQMDHIAGIGAVGHAMAEQVYAGLDALAPVTTTAIGRRARRPQGNWGLRIVAAPSEGPETGPGDGVRLRQYDAFSEADWRALAARVTPRERSSTYMDVLWKQGPRFELTVPCSIAIARDWHRHRPVMPWQLALRVQGDASQPALETPTLQMAPWYDIERTVGPALVQDTARAFWAHLGQRHVAPGDTLPMTDALLEAMHVLPFGTLVELSCVAPLPALVYMLELRMLAKGANPEYKAQARAALEQLCRLVPAEIVEREHLDGGLTMLAEREEAAHPV